MRERELYQKKKAAELDKWRADIDKLAARAKNSDAAPPMEVNLEIEALKQDLQAARAKLEELVKATDEAWHSIREGMESAWDPLESVFDGGTAGVDP